MALNCEPLQKLLLEIEEEDAKKGSAKTNEYRNDAESLKSLNLWIHEAKEQDQVEEAMQAIIEARGLEAILMCMKRDMGDTVVQNRALEILAGERYANGSLPFLDDSQICTKLAELGLVQVLLDVLRLPDLQAISRGLGCRALRCLSINPLVTQNIVDGSGVEVLIDQIYHVDRPFAFAALSALTRTSSTAQSQVRNAPQALPLLLTRFAQQPTDFSPPDDPAAAMLFISTWSWSEIKKQLEELGEAGFEAYDLLETNHLNQYKLKNMLSDCASSLSDFMSEIGNSYFYILTGKYEFMMISGAGIVFNIIMSTQTLRSGSCLKPILNILTLGYYNLLGEARMSWESGLKSDALTGLKIFNSINGMIRFFVSAYSLLLAGYITDFPELTGLQLATRWASIASSLLFLPLACRDAVIARMLPGKRDFGYSFLRMGKKNGFQIALVLYQGSEIWAQVTLLIFQMVAAPYGLYINWAVHLSLLFLAVIIFGTCSSSPSRISLYTFIPLPMAMFWTINGGGTSEKQIMSRAGATLRILNLGACWTYIYMSYDKHPDLIHHIQDNKSCLVLFGIGLVGTVVHFLSFLLQVYMGRWQFERMHPEGSSEVYEGLQQEASDLELQRIMLNSIALHGEQASAPTSATTVQRSAGGLYDTTSRAPLVVADRWKMVHEQLPNATARVPLDAFVDVHKVIASISNPTRNLDAESPFVCFLNIIFEAAAGLMLPKQKGDLGKHCFGYSSLVCDEYHETVDEAPDSLGLLKAPAIGWFDPLKVIRVQLTDDWSLAKKDANQHVDLASFKASALRRHEVKLGGISEATTAFTTFLDRVFEACRRISGRDDQQWLDEHGFIYASLMAYEFYFADARDAEKAEGCGCSTPVADNLGITKPPPRRSGQGKHKTMYALLGAKEESDLSSAAAAY